jgi:hypothetical protein
VKYYETSSKNRLNGKWHVSMGKKGKPLIDSCSYVLYVCSGVVSVDVADVLMTWTQPMTKNGKFPSKVKNLVRRTMMEYKNRVNSRIVVRLQSPADNGGPVVPEVDADAVSDPDSDGDEETFRAWREVSVRLKEPKFGVSGSVSGSKRRKRKSHSFSKQPAIRL